MQPRLGTWHPAYSKIPCLAGRLIVGPAFLSPSNMDRDVKNRDDFPDDISSQRSYSNSQRGPPPRFQEVDRTYFSTEVSPESTYANPHSPEDVSPTSQNEKHEYVPQSRAQQHETYQEGYVEVF